MTEPIAEPAVIEKIRALSQEKRRRKGEREARQRQALKAAIEKSKAASGEATEAPVRGGARPGSGRTRLFADSGDLVPNLDDVTINRLATAGPGKRPEFLRAALAHLVGDLAEDASLPEDIAAQIEHLDPALWPVPPGHDKTGLRSVPITAPAVLCASVKMLCGRGKVFQSVSQMARVAVTRELERRRGGQK